MFAATFRSWFWIILIAHWCGMLFWILRFVSFILIFSLELYLLILQRTIFCISDKTKYNPREAIFEKCYNLVCSYIFIFCYMVNLLHFPLQFYSILLLRIYVKVIHVHIISVFIQFIISKILPFRLYMRFIQRKRNLILKYCLVTFVCGGFWLGNFISVFLLSLFTSKSSCTS